MSMFAEEGMRDALKALWHECLGDSGEYIDLYFKTQDITRSAMVFMDGATLVSMLLMLPTTVVTRAGIMPARYIYAAATRESYRGRGLSTRLLEDAHKYLKAAGVKLSVVAPNSAKLYNFYERRGFESKFYAGRLIISGADIPQFASSFAVSEATPKEYTELRERAFSGRTMYARWDGDPLDCRITGTAYSGGETLIVTTGDARALAVCRNEEGIVSISGLALDGMKLIELLSVLQEKYHAAEYRMRLPLELECPYPLDRVASCAACWYDMDSRDMVMGISDAQDMSLVLD